MTLNIGLNLVEVDGRVAPSIQAAATSVTGFIIKAQRGIPGKVIQVTNPTQFQEHFGTFTNDAYGAYAVRGFFENGGSIAYITRVVNTTAGAAQAAVLTTNEGPWTLGQPSALTFKTNLSPNPISVTFTATGASKTGKAGPFNLDAGGGTGKKLSLTVNGILRGPYTFVAGDFAGGLGAATAPEVAAVLNREFPGIQALVDSNKLVVRTDQLGSGASLAASESAASELGLSGAAATGGGSVPNMDAVTPEQAVTIFGSALTPSGLLVSQDGKKVVIRHPNTGTAATIQVDPTSAAVATIFGLDTAVHAGTAGVASAAAVPSSADFGTDLNVKAGYRGSADPGAWADGLNVVVADNPTNVNLFDLSVLRNGAVVDSYTGLSMDPANPNFVEKIVNDDLAGSKFIVVKANSAAKPAAATKILGTGSNGTFADRASEVNGYIAAVDLFDLVDIQLLTCPEAWEAELVTKGLDHCFAKGDRMFVGHTQFTADADAAKTFGKARQRSKAYGALYFPWIRVADPLGGTKWIPPTGHILGMYGRTESERGIWKAPAGSSAVLNGALDVRYDITDVIHTDMVKNGGVNAVRDIPGLGIVVDSSRTLSTSPLWLYVNVRLLFNFVESSLKYGLRWVVQEPNDTTLWNKVKYNTVAPFLLGLWRRGAFGPGAPEDVFTVKIDAENNPPANIQQGILTCEIYFYPSRPAETIVLIIGQQEGGASAQEA